MSNNSNTVTCHYYGIDFLRTFSCFAIIIMHIYANGSFDLLSNTAGIIISSFDSLVYLFMMISGFGVCSGYYNKVKENTIDYNKFYKKRYMKTIPFFGVCLLLAVIIEHSVQTLIEAFMELTLSFGLLPNNTLETIGVSWFLGIVFCFYFMFPFFVFLTYNRKRALLMLIISIVINYLCEYYFFTEKFVVKGFLVRHSFLYCTPYLITGMIVFLFVDRIKSIIGKYKWQAVLGMSILIVMYYFVPNRIGMITVFTLKNIILYFTILCVAISFDIKLFNNRLIVYLSSISLEMYLCQMILFRLAERAKLLYIFGKGWVAFIFSSLLIIILIILFVECYRRMCIILKKIKQNEVKNR